MIHGLVIIHLKRVGELSEEEHEVGELEEELEEEDENHTIGKWRKTRRRKKEEEEVRKGGKKKEGR